MGIVLGDNIDYKGKKPLDSRMLFDTIAEMKAYSENYLPDITLAFNKEDDKMYVFNRENEVDTTTGKWREFESGEGAIPEASTVAELGTYLDGLTDKDYHKVNLTDVIQFPATSATMRLESSVYAVQRVSDNSVYAFRTDKIYQFGKSTGEWKVREVTAEYMKNDVYELEMDTDYTVADFFDEVSISARNHSDVIYVDQYGTGTLTTTDGTEIAGEWHMILDAGNDDGIRGGKIYQFNEDGEYVEQYNVMVDIANETIDVIKKEGTKSVYLTQIEYDNLTQEEQEDESKDYYIINMVNIVKAYHGGEEYGVGHTSLSTLGDTNITNPTDGQIMSFDETSEKWKNKDWVVDSEENTYEPDLDITDENGNVLVSFAGGHIKTKNFDSSNISQGKIGEANQTYHFSFSVNKGIANITDSTNNDQTNATYDTDWGAIKLPPNYTAGGTPVELVVRCHGTGGVIDSSTEFTGDVNIFLQNGMAVCDINGNPGQTSDSNDRGYGTPKSYRSYCKGLNYILTNFNINGLFVYGTSMGGLASTWLAENFPGVKVQGAFCPCIDVFKEAFLRPRNGATQRSKICTGFGFSGTAPTFGTKGSYSADEQAYILANKEKIRGRNNMLKSTTGIDLDEYLSTYATVYTEQTAEQALYANAVKYRQVPIKIWHGIDDQTVPYKYSKYFVEMCRKGGCIADLRTFPSGTGHSARSVGTKTVTTKYGGEITVSNSIYEMYVWFDGFR